MSRSFKRRLYPITREIAEQFGTPFHIYDERGIRETGESLKKAFAKASGFREFFAVKALPNPRILEIMRDMGFGFDCSSIPEIKLSQWAGAKGGGEIIFTSNGTSHDEFAEAIGAGAILNLDDISLVAKIPYMRRLICLRYNPGPRRTGNSIIGNPMEAKYGVTHEQIVEAYRQAMARGAQKFGIHTMICSNELNYLYMVETVRMLLRVVEMISQELGIRFEFINMGGGLGIPYKLRSKAIDLAAMAEEITGELKSFKQKHGYAPDLFMESGRYMTGPHGVLVTECINKKRIYRDYIQVDACMSSLMRPALYGAFHNITVLGKRRKKGDPIIDVVGSLCENNDKFAIQRALPEITEGDLLFIHDTGAHGYAMGFNYNGRLRPKELLLKADGNVELIRREETIPDYFATLEFKPKVVKPERRKP